MLDAWWWLSDGCRCWIAVVCLMLAAGIADGCLLLGVSLLGSKSGSKGFKSFLQKEFGKKHSVSLSQQT